MPMQTFDQYLRSDNADKLTAIAARVGVTPGRLSQLRRSVKWPPELALAIERETGGAVDAAHISPVVAQARR